MSSTARPTVRIGVFIPIEAQLLDTACVDVLCIMGYAYLSGLGDALPAALVDAAPDVQIRYVSQSRPGSTIPLTAGMRIAVNNHYSDEEVQPGKLDVVLVPGPDPSATDYEKDALAWLAAHAAQPGTDILSVCTGIFLVGAAGLLDTPGVRACGPRALQDVLNMQHPGVEWLGDRMRWVRDGQLWSSGGITNGNDLVAAYARESGRFPGPVAELGARMAEVGDRAQMYEH